MNKDIKALILLLGNNNTGELLANLLEKALGEIIGKQSSQGSEVIKKAGLVVSGVGIRQQSSWKTSKIFLLLSLYFFCAPFYWIMVSQISRAKCKSC